MKASICRTLYYASIATLFPLFSKKLGANALMKTARSIYRLKHVQGKPEWIEQANLKIFKGALCSYGKLPFKTRISLTQSFIEGIKGYRDKQAPFITVLDITYKCNLHCTNCFSADMKTTDTLERDQLSALLSDLQQNNAKVIILSGGEPLCYNEIYDIIRGFPTMFFFIFTNGTLIDKNVISRMKTSHNTFHLVSIDGDEPMITNRRGPKVYSKIQNAIGLLNNGKIPYGVSTTITKSNQSFVISQEFINYYAERKSLTFLYLLLNVISCNNEEYSDRDTYLQLSKTLESIRLHDRNELLILNLPWDESKFASNGCFAGTHIIHIDVYGGIRLCPFSRDVIANVNDFSNFQSAYSYILRQGKCNVCAQHDNATLSLETEIESLN